MHHNEPKLPAMHVLPIHDTGLIEVRTDDIYNWEGDEARRLGREFGNMLCYKANGNFFEGMLEALREEGYTVSR